MKLFVLELEETSVASSMYFGYKPAKLVENTRRQLDVLFFSKDSHIENVLIIELKLILL